MRYSLHILVGIVAAMGCSADASKTMTNEPEPPAPLFAVGSNEQARLDRFLAKFPPERAARFRKQFETREVIIAARNSELQSEIDAIYEALDKREAAGPAKLEGYRPGPIEEKLIQEYLALLPPDEGNKYIKSAFYAKNARNGHDDPKMQKMIDAIYKARKDEFQFRVKRDLQR